jgi:hypothetical protein
MKAIALKISTLFAAILLSVLPALAGEMGTGMGTGMDQEQQGQKDQCLLMAMNCGDRIDTIQQRIGRISHEISKGSAVYTGDELRQLDSQLNDARRTLESLIGGA